MPEDETLFADLKKSKKRLNLFTFYKRKDYRPGDPNLNCDLLLRAKRTVVTSLTMVWLQHFHSKCGRYSASDATKKIQANHWYLGSCSHTLSADPAEMFSGR